MPGRYFRGTCVDTNLRLAHAVRGRFARVPPATPTTFTCRGAERSETARGSHTGPVTSHRPTGTVATGTGESDDETGGSANNQTNCANAGLVNDRIRNRGTAGPADRSDATGRPTDRTDASSGLTERLSQSGGWTSSSTRTEKPRVPQRFPIGGDRRARQASVVI